MSGKVKIVLLIFGSAMIVFVLANIIVQAPYRSHLPALTDLQALPPVLQDQVTQASRKAYWHPSADNLGTLGMIYHSSEHYDEAGQCYALANKKDPSKWIWSYYLGYLNKEMGLPAKSVENFTTVVKENSNVYLAWYYMGEGYQNLGLNNKAEAAFKKIADLKENNPTTNPNLRKDHFPLRIYAKYQLSSIYLNSGKLDLSEKTLQEILQEYPTFGTACRLLGNVYNKKGSTELSNQYGLRANDLINYYSPIDPLMDQLALLSKSDKYLMKQADEAEKGIYPEWAMKLIYKGVEVKPDNKYLISKAVKLFLKMGAVQQILPLLNQHFSYFKDDNNEIKEVAELLQDNGAHPESLNYYRQAVKLNPKDMESQSFLIMALFNTGMKAQAIDYLDQLHEKDKTNVEILSNGVYILLTMGENEKADSYMAKLKQIAPSDAKVQQLAGIIAERDGKLMLAINLYESSFKGNPKDLATIEMLGNILVKQKLWEKAIHLYRQAIESHPNEPYLMDKLGSLLIGCPNMKLRNIDEGLQYSSRALDHKASSPEIIISASSNLGDAYAAKGDKQTASVYLNRSLDMARRNNASKAYLQEIETRLTKYRK